MKTVLGRRAPAIGCSLVILCCLPLVRPWLGMGVHDEPSYIRTAELLAQTGHVIYNGWAGPILGWHLYWGALFIRLFGFSFDVARLSTLPIAMLFAFLSQRTMVRCGLNQWNATLATLSFLLAPLFLPLVFTFMTDVGGMLVIVACFYACLRALQASSDRNACLWIAFAAIGNAVGGSIRQTCWIPLVLMVPCTLWLLRGRRVVVLWGSVSVLVGLGIVLVIVRWHAHQPFTIITSLLPTAINKTSIVTAIGAILSLLLDLPVVLLPLLVPFVDKVRWSDVRSRRVFVVALVALAGFGVLVATRSDPTLWLWPTAKDVVTSVGMFNGTYIHGARPVVLSLGVRSVATGVALFCICAFAGFVARRPPARAQDAAVPPMRHLLLLLLPFCIGYCGAVATQGLVDLLFDRYLLPLLYIAFLLLARLYQDRVAPRIPAYAYAFVALLGLYTIAATHDAFAMFRAWLKAADEVTQSGVPREQVDAGWQYNSWTELQLTGFLQWSTVRIPPGTIVPSTNLPHMTCRVQMWNHAPLLQPRFALSYEPNNCSGPAPFAPVHYSGWLGPRDATVYVVKDGPGPTNDSNHY